MKIVWAFSDDMCIVYNRRIAYSLRVHSSTYISALHRKIIANRTFSEVKLAEFCNNHQADRTEEKR
jgi:hypothetical protein